MKDLLRIASLLDSSGNYKLSDKLFKIAQYSDLVLRQPGVNNSSNQMFLEPGAEYLRPAPDITWADGLNKLESLYSNNAYNFAKNLYEFGRKNNITSLADAFDMYADAGALFDNQSIKVIPVMQNLYSKVLNHNEMITEQQLAKELDQMLQENNTYQGMPGLMKEPMNPSSYSDYATYLRETGQNRKAPIGTNNDDEKRRNDFTKDPVDQWKDAINIYANNNDLSKLQDMKNSINRDVILDTNSKSEVLNYLAVTIKEFIKSQEQLKRTVKEELDKSKSGMK
jgi:hypothetical protein